MIQRKIFKILIGCSPSSEQKKELSIRVTTEGNRIIDVAVQASAEVRAEFLSHFTQKNISAQTNCYTGLLQKGLVEYNYHHTFTEQHSSLHEKEITDIMQRIKQCLKPFAQLERLVNDPLSIPGSDSDQLAYLLSEVEACFKEVSAVFSGTDEGVYPSLRKNLLAQKEKFVTNIQDLQKKQERDHFLPIAELQQLFCMQDGAIDGWGQIQSLGSYMAAQMYSIAGDSIQEIYRVTNNRVQQAFYTHPAIKALSEVKADFEKRTLAANGARSENSQTPVPKELLDLIIDEPDLTEEKKEETPIKKWLSITPYVNQLSNVEEVNKMLFLLAGKEFIDRPLNWWLLGGMFFSSIWEVFISLIHVAFSVVSFGLEFFCWVRNLSDPKRPWSMNKFDNLVTRCHHALSLMRRLRNKLREDYVSGYSSSQEHQDILNDLWKKADKPPIFVIKKESDEREAVDPENSLNLLLSEYSGHRIATVFGNGVRGLGQAVKEVGVEFKFVFWFIFRSTMEKRAEVVENQQRKVLQHWVSILDIVTKKEKEATEIQQEEKEEQQETTRELALTEWVPGKPCARNEVKSIGDPLGRIAVGVADDFIDRMFRLNAGPATACFSLSLTSFIVLLVPSLSAGSNTAWLGWFAGWLSKSFTGKTVSEGVSAKLVSVFLQWKVLVLASEAGLELAEGNVNFLRAFFKDMDRTTLILLILVAGGIGLGVFHKHPIPADLQRYIDPNRFIDPVTHPWLNGYLNRSLDFLGALPAFINRLGEESAHCRNGAFGFRDIEYLILGAQFAVIVQAAVTSTKSVEGLNIKKIEELTDSFFEDLKKQDWRNLQDSTQIKQMIKDLLAQHGFKEPDGDQAKQQYGKLLNKMVNSVEALKRNGSITISSESDSSSAETKEKKQKAAERSAVYLASEKLKAAILHVNEMACLGDGGFGSKEEAWLYSDYLSDCFDEYIQNIARLGRPTDKEYYLKARYLANFDNKYCTNDVILLAKFFSIIPFYPFTLIWRAIKYVLTNSPCIRREVSKSFSKDLFMIMQLATDLLRPIRAFARAISYTLRFALGGVFAILAAIFLLLPALFCGQKKNALAWIESIFSKVTVISFHRTNFTGKLKAWYAKLARDCNTSQQEGYLKFASEQVLQQLKNNLPLLPQEKQAAHKEHKSWVAMTNRMLDEKTGALESTWELGYLSSSASRRQRVIQQLATVHATSVAKKEKGKSGIDDEIGKENKDDPQMKSIIKELNNSYDIAEIKATINGHRAGQRC